MTYKERLYICKSNHQQRSWQWGDVQSIRCSTKGCKLKAFLAISGGSRFAQNAQPFVYYERPGDGEIFIAATAADTRHPRGFVRREIRTMNEYNKFRRQRNERTRSNAEIVREMDRMDQSAANREGRERLQAMMSSLSPEGRKLAEAAIERSYQDSTPGISVDSFLSGVENDRSTREPYNAPETDWKRRD